MADVKIQTEKSKNIQASLLTLFTCATIGLFFSFTYWTLQPSPRPVLDSGIEVNLGYGDEGFGDIAPLVPGDPAPDIMASAEESAAPMMEEEAMETASRRNNIASEEVAVHKEIVRNEEKNVPVIKTTSKPKSTTRPPKTVEKLTATEAPKKKTTTAARTTATRTTATTTTKIATKTESGSGTSRATQPKAVYRGGTGAGGNRADSYNGVTSQGIAGASGDQGRANGNLTSDSYRGNGGTGTSGVSIREGLSGRRIVGYPSLSDKFDQDARVAVKIVVDAAGTVTSASINPKGTTTTSSNIRNIAIRKAKQLKLSKSTAKVQTGTILFNFRLKV